MRVKLVLYVIGVCIACQGCAPLWHVTRTSILQPLVYPRWLNEIIDCEHDRKLAKAAWADFSCTAPTAYSSDFKHGFQDGFADYLFWGGTGAPPPVPPRCYWNAKYETPEGQQAIQDWFAGFRAGAERAHESGYRNMVIVPASASLPPLLPSESSANSSSAAGSGALPGSGAGPEEMLPPPRPVPTPQSPATPGPTLLGPKVSVVPSQPREVPSAANTEKQSTSLSRAALQPPQIVSPPPSCAREPDTNQLLAMLRNAWDPSQREWAAEQMARQDASLRSPLRENLTRTANEDPSAVVRAVCWRLLAEAGLPCRAELPIRDGTDLRSGDNSWVANGTIAWHTVERASWKDPHSVIRTISTPLGTRGRGWRDGSLPGFCPSCWRQDWDVRP
jgi:hypothetical protein